MFCMPYFRNMSICLLNKWLLLISCCIRIYISMYILWFWSCLMYLS